MNLILPSLASRNRHAEWMDDPNVDPAALARGLRFIRRVNSFLGYTRATLGHLDRFSRNWKKGEPVRILDVATGSADVPIAILRWAERRGHDVRITAVDLHTQTLDAARLATRHIAGDRLSLLQADALALPFAAGEFDYAMTNMFLHHLDDDQAVQVLVEMDRVACRGILAADLVRSRRAYAWIRLFTLLADRMVRHDARVSVAQAFTRPEVEALCERAGLDYLRYRRHFGHRFVLAGEKM